MREEKICPGDLVCPKKDSEVLRGRAILQKKDIQGLFGSIKLLKKEDVGLCVCVNVSNLNSFEHYEYYYVI
jgi:hypothetical protein